MRRTDQFSTFAAQARTLAARCSVRVWTPALSRVLDRNLEDDVERVVNLGWQLDLEDTNFWAELGVADLFKEAPFAPRADVRLLVQSLRACSEMSRRLGMAPDSAEASAGPRDYEKRPLALLAALLPAEKRSRFVAEAQGNLGDCEHWWQRVDVLVCLAIGMPRLAWMMWRDRRRGRV